MILMTGRTMLKASMAAWHTLVEGHNVSQYADHSACIIATSLRVPAAVCAVQRIDDLCLAC